MRTISTVLATGLLVVLMLSLGASAAVALRSIEIGARTELSDTAFALTFESEGVNVICEATLAKTLNARISKRFGAAIGNMTMSVHNPCSGGIVTILNTREGWPLTYDVFDGTLPSIRDIFIQVIGFAVLIESFGGLGRCLYRGDEEIVTGPNERVTQLRFDEIVTIPLFRNLGVSCGERGAMAGVATATRTVTLRLV